MAGPACGPASAQWGDAEDSRPVGAVFDIGGPGVATPYSAAFGAMLHKHTEEIKANAQATLNLPGAWKKRLRDFLTTKNNDLLDFMKLSVKSHPVLGPGEILLRRFGNPQVTPTHPSVKDMVLDISGEDVLEDISKLFSSYAKENPLKDYASFTRIIYDEYRKAGDEVLSQQTVMKAKLDKFDKLQGRLTNLFDIEPNEHYDTLMKSTEAYLKKIFEDNMVEDNYKKLVQAYRRFAILRDVVTMSRSLLAQESEPICSICLDESVSYALTPCGHTLCQTCMRRQTNQCFMCRVPIRDKVKLFF